MPALPLALLKNRAFIAAALLGLALFFTWRWQPERQLLRRQEKFIGAFAARDYDKAVALMATDFHDGWGHDREAAIREAREVLRQFFILDLEQQEIACTLAGAHATIRARLRMSGRGSPFAHMAMDAVNGLSEPFIFTWRRTGAMPWAWEIVAIAQPQLHIDAHQGWQ